MKKFFPPRKNIYFFLLMADTSFSVFRKTYRPTGSKGEDTLSHHHF